MKDFRIGRLLDIYGRLLTERQREVLRHYYDYDLSYGEISDQLGISRQAVGQVIDSANRQLEEYESALKLLDIVVELEELKRTLAQDDTNYTNLIDNIINKIIK